MGGGSVQQSLRLDLERRRFDDRECFRIPSVNNYCSNLYKVKMTHPIQNFRKALSLAPMSRQPRAEASTLPAYLRVQPDGLWLAVKVQPRSSVNEIVEPLGAELRVKVTAPPVDSAANEAVLRLLVERLDCARNQVELVRGHTSRHKVIKVHGLSAASVIARLRPADS